MSNLDTLLLFSDTRLSDELASCFCVCKVFWWRVRTTGSRRTYMYEWRLVRVSRSKVD